MRLALIGSPVYHSKSPDVWARIFSDAGLCGSFSVIEVSAVGKVRDIMLSRGIDGFCVTMPHKMSIISQLDATDETAQVLQSVNCVTVRDGVFCGYSTDGEGFCRALEKTGVDVSDKKVLIYGTGGAACSVGYALKKRNARVSVCGRSAGHVEELCERLGFERDVLSNAPSYDVFINATPLGMTEPFPSLHFLDDASEDLFVCDLVYSPPVTELLRYAESRGHRTMNGSFMLREQARAAFEIFLSR